MHLWWLTIALLSTGLQIASSVDYVSVGVGLSADNQQTSSDGLPAFSLNQMINLTVNIQVVIYNKTYNRNIIIQIQLPSTQDFKTNCRQWYGYGDDNTGPNSDKCQITILYSNYATLCYPISSGFFSISPSNSLKYSVPPSFNSLTNTLTYNLQNASSLPEFYNIKIVQQIASIQASDIGVKQTINTTVIVQNLKDSASMSTLKQFKILGPKMKLFRSSGFASVAAGQNFSGSLTLQQDSSSTENPQNVLVTISASDTNFFNILSASGQNITFNNSVWQVNLSGPIALYDSLTYDVILNVSKNAPLGLDIYLSYTLSWRGADGKQYAFPATQLYWAFVKPPFIQEPLLTNCTKLTFETLCKVTLNLTMTSGVLSNLSFLADFDASASSMNRMPIEVYQSIINTSTSLVQFSNDTLLRLTNEDFTTVIINQRRKRRSTGQHVTLVRPNVTLTNPLPYDVNVILETSFIVSSVGLTGNGQVTMSLTLSYYNKLIWLLDYTPVLVVIPVLNIEKNFGNFQVGPYSNYPQYTTFLTVENVNSTAAAEAYNVAIIDSYNYTILKPNFSIVVITQSNNLITAINVNTRLPNQIYTFLPILKIGEVANLSYTVALKEYKNLTSNVIMRPWKSLIRYYTSNDGVFLPMGFVHPQIHIDVTLGCLFNNITYPVVIVPNVGQILLSVFLGLICGFLCVLIIVFLVWCGRALHAKRRRTLIRQIRKMRFLLTSTAGFEPGGKENVKMNMSNDTSQYIKIGKALTPSSQFAVFIRGDKQQIEQGLQRRHLEEALKADKELESRQEQLMIDAVAHLIKSIERRNFSEPSKVQKVLDKFHQSVEKINMEHKAELKQLLKDLKVDLSARNKIDTTRLNMQFRKQKELLEHLDNISSKERAELKSQLKLEQTTIFQQMIHDLLIDQETTLEEARKGQVIKKRHELRQAAHKAMEKITTAINNEDVAKQLLSEHYQLQSQLAFAQSTEIARQRGFLDLRLERRRQQLTSQEFGANLRETAHTTVRDQNRRMLRNVEKKHLLSHKITHRLLRKAKRNEKSIYKKCRNKQTRLEDEMSKKLAEQYKVQLTHYLEEKEARAKALQQELLNDDVSLSSTAHFVQKICQFQYAEAQYLEQFDEDWENQEMEQLTNIRKRIDANIQTQLENELDNMANCLLEECQVPEYNINKIVSNFSRKRALLAEEQAQLEKERSEKLQNELERRRNMKFEREAGILAADIQEHDFADQLSMILVEKQGALSMDEKERVMRQHESNLEKLQNNLALGRFQQQQQFNQRLADKRVRNREILEQRHQIEIRNAFVNPSTLLTSDRKKLDLSNLSSEDSESHFSDLDAEDDVDDGEKSVEKKKQRAWLHLLRRQQKERLNVVDVGNATLDEIASQIEEEILLRRQELLERQQEQFAAQLAQLQINKAKEIARIEEQQLCIAQLKMGLIDDLTSRGIIGNEKCSEILATHKQQEAALLDKLAIQRQQQEENLRSRLQKQQQRLEIKMQSEQTMELKQLDNSGELGKRLRTVFLRQKHAIENEKLKQRSEVEAKQIHSELARLMELKKSELFVSQELEIVSSLAELGKFSKTELRNVLISLFPLKSNEEIEYLLSELDVNEKAQNVSPNSQLLQKTEKLREITKSVINKGHIAADFISKLHEKRNKTLLLNQPETFKKYSRSVGHLSNESLESNNTHLLTPLSIYADTEETNA